MRRLFSDTLSTAFPCGFFLVAFFFVATFPGYLDLDSLDWPDGDPESGRIVFLASGCGSCHSDPSRGNRDNPVLGGGLAFKTEFGTFHAPNISPHPEHGIGGWSEAQLAAALIKGSSPGGRHYFPAFPYTSYSRFKLSDVADLKAYLDTLEPSSKPSAPHDVALPWLAGRLMLFWKLSFADRDWIVDPVWGPEAELGRYLVEALGHCGECHTPRNSLGGLRYGSWLQGAKDPVGGGMVPGITPAALQWSKEEIVEYLSSGFTPDFDSAGSHMAEVVENTSALPPEYRSAIAEYLLQVPD